MPRAFLPLAVLGAVVLALLLAWLLLRGGGDAERVVTQPIEVGAFREVRVTGHAEVVLVQGDAGSVVVEAVQRSHSRVTVRAEDGVLSIFASENAPWWSSLLGRSDRRPPRVTVRFREIDTLVLAGAVRVSADRWKAGDLSIKASGATSVAIEALDASTFRFAGSGAVKGELSGRATAQEVLISGAGSYRAAEFVTDRADVKVSGAGKVVVHANRTLDAAISGAGAIDYRGNPEVRERISGAGRIRRLSDTELRPRGHYVAAMPLLVNG